MLEYAALPGILGDRLFQVFDTNGDNYIDLNEFVNGFSKIYCTSFEEKCRLVFDIYDFNHDGCISKEDIQALLQFMPLVNIQEGMAKEGKFK